MRLPTLIAWLFGAALLVTLVALNHPGRILEAVAALRFWLVLVIAYHAVPLVIDTIAWRRLFMAPPPLPMLVRVRWIADSVNGLLPVPHLGELLRAELVRRTNGGGEAAASVVVDITLGIATEVVFTALGLALFSALLPPGSGLLRGLLLALALLVLAGATFYLLQRAGLFALAARLARRWSATARRRIELADAHALDGRIRTLYGRRSDLLLAALWRLFGWVAGAGEAWLALAGLGHPVSFGEAIMLESLSHAARTAAFAIPGGLGVQDGALLLLCAQLGLGPEMGLALSLTKRCRELALGLPGLVAAYLTQAHRLAR